MPKADQLAFGTSYTISLPHSHDSADKSIISVLGLLNEDGSHKEGAWNTLPQGVAK